MTKKRRRGRGGKPIFAIGCLTVLAGLVVAGVLIAPRVKSLFTPTRPGWAGMPWYGPSQEMTVTRGSVSEGVSAFGAVSPAREARLAFEQAGGEVVSSLIEVGMPVTEGQVLVELDRAALERDLAKTRATLQNAEEALAELQGGASDAAESLRLEVELAAAEQALAEARAALAAYSSGGDTPAAQRSRAAQELAAARAEREALLNDGARLEQIEYLQWIYSLAEAKHGEMVAIPNPSEQDVDNTWLLRIDMLAKRESLDLAKMQYDTDKRAAEHRVAVAARAVAALDAQIAAGLGDIERQKLEADVAKAEAKVAITQEALAAVGSDLLGAKVAEAQAKVLKAEGAVRDAEKALDNAVLVAPFTGAITEGSVVPGQLVTAGAPLGTIEDAGSLRVVAQVNEIDIARLQEGQEVVLSFDAFQGEPPRRGRVGEIPLYGKYANGTTVFSVPIAFDAEGLVLFQGMSANVIFPSATKEDVLVVPAAAVFTDPEGDYVMFMADGQPEKRYITTGISDGIYTEIVAGLEEGDVVNVPMMGPRGSGMPMYYGGMY